MRDFFSSMRSVAHFSALCYTKAAMNTIIVIPTYNEAENIAALLDAIFALSIANLSVMVVDDASPDGTANIVRSHPQATGLYLLERKGKLGIGSAYLAGFAEALKKKADYVFEMDADFSHNPKDILRMLAAAQEGADLVIGSRKIAGGNIVGWGVLRKFMSTGAMWFSRTLLGIKVKDVTSGFRCFTRRVLETLPLTEIKSNGYAFQEELLYRTQLAGFTIKEIPVTFHDRKKGKSKLSKKDIIEFFWIMLLLRFGKQRSS